MHANHMYIRSQTLMYKYTVKVMYILFTLHTVLCVNSDDPDRRKRARERETKRCMG